MSYRILFLIVLFVFCFGAYAESKDAPKPKSKPAVDLPHIQLDREKKTVDIEGKVCLREGDWLELLACVRGTKEHESIIAVRARASHVHLALLLVGLEPGKPQTGRREGEKFIVDPPRGPRVAVSLVYRDKSGKTVEVPASQWILNRNTGKPMADNEWLFTGSRFETIRVPVKPGSEKYNEKEVYGADLSGTIMSIVNFGDDLLSRDTNIHNKNDEAVWQVNTKLVPKIGADVTIRLRPAPKKKRKPIARKPVVEKKSE